MNRYVYEAILIKKVRISVTANNDDDAWERLMEVPADEWDTVGVPQVEDIEVLDVIHEDEEGYENY